MPHAFHALAAQGQGVNPQHPIDPYMPLMPSLSLDSFFASYDEQNAAAQRAQAPLQLVENVLPAWEDLGNGQSGSLAVADWHSMLRGDSLALSEASPSLVDHGGNMVMIEPGGQQESWAQDIPAAMRTPSLEARQARAAALLRQNMELQQRQSSLERRAAYQKSLLAANREQMQAAAAAMLQQAQANQANGVPFNIAAFQQRLLAAARQGAAPNAAALQGLFRPQDMNQAAALAGLTGQMPPPTFNQQMPPPPPPQRPYTPASSMAAGPAAAAMPGRQPPQPQQQPPPQPQQQPGGVQGPMPRSVGADWARAYREQQHKAAQAALARSAKWNTTEPPVRPTPSRQGMGPSSLDAIAASSICALSPGKPLLSLGDSPRLPKLDALLQRQQQQQQQQSSSSSEENKQAMSSPGVVGPHPGLSGQGDLHQSHSDGALGPIGPLVWPCSF